MNQRSTIIASQAGRSVILIIGMHRSGTSLLSSIVHALGVNVGDDLYPADPANPAGYFEDRACVDIQERILRRLGQPWSEKNGMLPFPSLWWRTAEMRPLVEELEAWLDRRLQTAGLTWAVKDPRTTRFLPLWRELLQKRGVSWQCVLAVRSPAEVVASEVTRDGVPAERVYRTWLRYNMEAVLHAGPALAAVVLYSRWFTDGPTQLCGLAAALSVEIDSSAATRILGDVLREDLYRQNAVRESLAPAWAEHVYLRLQALSNKLFPREIADLATEAEYLDAMLRQGDDPLLQGPLVALIPTQGKLDEFTKIALRHQAEGARLVLVLAEQMPDAAISGGSGSTLKAATVRLESTGPAVEGGPQVRATFTTWRWLETRAYSEIHIEGGSGLAAHCLDARRQGLPDFHGAFHVHYPHLPSWIRNDGRLNLCGTSDVEAFGLERRTFFSPNVSIHAPPVVESVLRRTLAQKQVRHPEGNRGNVAAPLVSVCLIHHDRPNLLSDCLESIYRQTYLNFEVVLVDDGSTLPASQFFLDSLADEFRRKGWSLVRQENGYLGRARNTAARIAKGEYLFFLDDDNLLIEGGLERAVEVAQRTGADIVTSVMSIFSAPAGNRPTLPERLWVFLGEDPLRAVFDNNLGDANALVRRDCWNELGGYSEDRGVGAEDWEFYAKAVLKGYRLEHSLRPLIWYRLSANSMARTGDWWVDYRRALRPYEALMPSSLQELPALAGVLWREVNRLTHSRQVDAEAMAELVRQHEATQNEALQIAQKAARAEADLRAELDAAQSRVERAQAEAQSLAQERTELAVRCEALVRSSSWRITRPLRVATALAKGDPAYVAQLGKVPGMRIATFPFVWARQQLGRTQRMARLAPRLSRRVGGTVPLMRRGMRILRQQGLNGLRTKLRQFEAGSAATSPLRHEDAEAIARGIFAQQQSELSADLARQMQDGLGVKPLISVIMPVYKTPVQWLRRAVESLRDQYYDNWELCAVDDGSPGDAQRNLLQELAASDVRVRFRVMERNCGISAASNVALEMARGEYVALLDHDDELTPDALFRVVEVINRQPDADFIYSDECKVSDTTSRQLYHFIFKPEWSPDLMFNSMLTGHLTVYRKGLVADVGAFRGRYDFSQDYDLALRAAEAAKRIVHIERVLYLWRSIPGSAAAGGKDFARETNIAALNDALHRRGVPGEAIPLPHANYVRITLPAEPPLLSIVIPSDSAENLRMVLRSILEETDYPNFEVVVVCNGPLADRLAGEFSGRPELHFVKYDRKYNFSDKCNDGARAARGEVVVFYNDDVFPLQRDWVERLIEYLWVPGVGGVSPKLLHADDTIQYAGMISGTPGLCGTAYNNVPRDATDPFLSMHKYVRNVSILSGACCALWKDLFHKVGAFDAVHTPDGHSDMDLSYKLIEAGYRCVYTPHALLRHIGNHSWDAKPDKYKADIYALKRWGRQLSKDPYFTDSMKRVLYRDFRFEYRIYAEHLDPQENYTGPDILFVSHELTLTGAPRMLLYAAIAVRRNGGFPVVVAPADGPIREELIKAGIAVIIDESIRHNHFLFDRFARNFDLAVVNTVALADVVRQLSAIPILRTIWWLHEAQSLSLHLNHMSRVDWQRVCTLCVSDYARSFVPPGIAVEVLRNGVPDQTVASTPRSAATPMTFVLAGTIEPRKGQDLLVEAVALLPPGVRRQCRFLLTGKLWDEHRGFWSSLEAKMASLPQIEYLGPLDRQSQLRLIAAADVIVCCSRDEPASLVVAEAAMLSRPVILSRRVGLLEVLDGDSCLVFQPEDVASLAEQLLAAHRKRGDLPRMGIGARRSYEQELTIETFERRFMALVSAQIAKGRRPSGTAEQRAASEIPPAGFDLVPTLR